MQDDQNGGPADDTQNQGGAPMGDMNGGNAGEQAPAAEEGSVEAPASEDTGVGQEVPPAPAADENGGGGATWTPEAPEEGGNGDNGGSQAA